MYQEGQDVGTGEEVPGEAQTDVLLLSGADDPPEPPRQNPVDRGILDALTDLVKQAGAISHSIAASFGVAPSDLLALFKLSDGVVSMKELAQRMGCDASFVTVIADTLEREGLARREPSLRDRRVKELVLTPKGIAAQERLMRELATRMPWCNGLDETERHCFLRLLNKMLASERGDADHLRENRSAQAGATVRSG
jgi:MarR family transcriptional regulator, organic hydroperoxide resistance regulator